MNYVTTITRNSGNRDIKETVLSCLKVLVKSVRFIGNKPLSLDEVRDCLKKRCESCPNVLLVVISRLKGYAVHNTVNSLFRNNYRLIFEKQG